MCILNPFHSFRRNKITLMEEISHIYLGHKPSGVTYAMDGVEVRDYHQNQEAEAYGVGAAALLPWQPFFNALKAGHTVVQLSEINDVTPDLIGYRIKTTGAYNLYRSRQARRREGR